MFRSPFVSGARSVAILTLLVSGGALVSGCANNPLMQTPPAHSTDSVDAIGREMAQATQVNEAPVPAQGAVPSAVTQALLPPMQMSGAREVVKDERFNLSVDNLPARAFFMGLVKGTPYNMVVHPEVIGEISLDLKNVTIDEVMHIVRKNYGYDYRLNNGLYQVLPGGLRTEIYPINYIAVQRRGSSEVQVSSGQVSTVKNQDNGSASGSTGATGEATSSSVVGTRISTQSDSDFWGQLRETLQVVIGPGEGRSIVTTPNAGIVVVRAMPSELRAVEDYLRRTQLIMQRQVILEAKILEVVLDKGFEQGINWNYYADYTSRVDDNGDPVKALLTNLGSEAITNQGVGGVFGAALRVNDFTAFIQLLGKQGNVQVLSSPRISTVNNQKAVIKVGTDEFFVTDIDVNEDSNTNTTGTSQNTSVTLTPFFSGIALDVTPQISEEGGVILHVHPSVSEVKDQTKVVSLGGRDLTLPLAFSTIRETDSIISARNGQIVVIGGLIQNTSQDDNAEVPFFSKIPVLGEAFKQKRQSSRKSELVILLRPIIADANGIRQDISDSRDRFDELGRVLSTPDSRAP